MYNNPVWGGCGDREASGGILSESICTLSSAALQPKSAWKKLLRKRSRKMGLLR